MQHSVPSLAQAVQGVEPGFDENPDPHVTLVLAPSLFAHVLAAVHARMHVRKWGAKDTLFQLQAHRIKKQGKNVRMQHSVPSSAQAVQEVEPGFDENPDPHVTLVLAPSWFAHVLAAMHECICVCMRENDKLTTKEEHTNAALGPVVGASRARRGTRFW